MDEAIRDIDFNKIIENPNEAELYENLALEIIDYLKCNRNVKFNDLIKNVGCSDRRTLRLLDQMVNLKKIIFENDSFSLNKSDIPIIESSEVSCKYCEGKMISLDGKIEDIMSIMKKIYEEKPKPTFIFDQRPVNYETTVRRAAYLIWRRDIQGKKIAILGDDDLTSIAVGLTGLSKDIVVFEIDKRLANFIKKQSKKFKLNITVIEQDLTKEIPQEYVDKFDVFMTDPTPTRTPFTVFTNVGIKLLNKKKTSVGYLSFLPSCMPKNIELQKIITNMGLLITDIIPFFTQYDFVKETYSKKDLELLQKYSKGKSDVSFFEHLIRVETTKETKITPIEYKIEDLFGRATKRVLENPEKDPAISVNDTYIKEILKQKGERNENR